MAKSNQIFTCTSCGHESPKWLGICPGCKEWNSFIEQEKITDKKNGFQSINPPSMERLKEGKNVGTGRKTS